MPLVQGQFLDFERDLKKQNINKTGENLVYKIPYRRARAWPSGFVQPLGRVRRASKGILHTRENPDQLTVLSEIGMKNCVLQGDRRGSALILLLYVYV